MRLRFDIKRVEEEMMPYFPLGVYREREIADPPVIEELPNDYSYESLGHYMKDRHMEPFLVTFEPVLRITAPP